MKMNDKKKIRTHFEYLDVQASVEVFVELFLLYQFPK